MQHHQRRKAQLPEQLTMGYGSVLKGLEEEGKAVHPVEARVRAKEWLLAAKLQLAVGPKEVEP